MRFFLETEDMVEMKDTGVLSYEDLLLLLDFVFCMVTTSKDFYYRLVKEYGTAWNAVGLK